MKNIYLDFDHTLYCTTKLKDDIMHKVFDNMCKVDDNNMHIVDIETILVDNNSMFEFCNKINKKCKKSICFKPIIVNILNSNNYIYSDSIPFLKKLKQYGFEINLLTYSKPIDFEFQMLKICNTNILNLIDNIIICSCDKNAMNLDYKNGVFIDDKAEVLDKLYNAGVTSDRLYKISRPDGKYSKTSTIFKTKEYNNLSEIKVEDII